MFHFIFWSWTETCYCESYGLISFSKYLSLIYKNTTDCVFILDLILWTDFFLQFIGYVFLLLTKLIISNGCWTLSLLCSWISVLSSIKEYCSLGRRLICLQVSWILSRSCVFKFYWDIIHIPFFSSIYSVQFIVFFIVTHLCRHHRSGGR